MVATPSRGGTERAARTKKMLGRTNGDVDNAPAPASSYDGRPLGGVNGLILGIFHIEVADERFDVGTTSARTFSAFGHRRTCAR
jgi:hypothetical protein